MRFDGQQHWLWAEGRKDLQGSTNFLPASAKLAARHRNKLVEDLDRQRTARG